MIRTPSIQWLSVGIVACFVIGAVVLLVISGTFAVSGELWDVDGVSDVEIGTEQQQVITNIEVLDPSEPVKVHIGNIVDSGAKLDHNATSYWIDINGETRSTGVYLENASTSNATVIISASAISGSGRFDLYLDNIDTTDISRYDQDGEKINRAISYTAEQGRTDAIVDFSVSSPISVGFKSDTYNKSTQSIFYEYSINNSSIPDAHVTIWKKKGQGNIGEKIKTVELSERNVSLKGTGIEGKAGLIIGVHPSTNKHGSDVIYSLDTTTINVSVPAQIVSGPFYYTKNTPTLLFEFNTNISNSQGRITVNLSNGSTKNMHIGNKNDNYNINNEFLYAYPLASPNASSHGTLPEITNIEINNISTSQSRLVETSAC